MWSQKRCFVSKMILFLQIESLIEKYQSSTLSESACVMWTAYLLIKDMLYLVFPNPKPFGLSANFDILIKITIHTSGKQYHCNQRQFRMYWNVGSRTNMINQRHLITGFPHSQFHFLDPRTIPRNESPHLPDSGPDDPEQDVNMRKILSFEGF